MWILGQYAAMWVQPSLFKDVVGECSKSTSVHLSQIL